MIEVTCPHCGTQWELGVKESVDTNFTCSDCKKVFSVPAVLENQREQDVSALTKRYRDAYRVAKATNAFGTVIQVIGVILGLLVFVFVLVAASITRQGAAVAIVGLVPAFVVGCLFFLLGMLVSAVGQIQKATLDTAVNTSPLLGNSDRASIMSLRTTHPSAPEGDNMTEPTDEEQLV